jgi:hypothetical protein
MECLFQRRCGGRDTPNQNREGPGLRGDYGCKAVRDSATLDHWLTYPDAMAPDERMDQLTERMDRRTERVAQTSAGVDALALKFDRFIEITQMNFDRLTRAMMGGLSSCRSCDSMDWFRNSTRSSMVKLPSF